MADTDWGAAEQDLKDKAGQWYDPTMLDDLKRNSSNNGGGGDSVGGWTDRIAAKAQLRGSNDVGSTYQANGQGGQMIGPKGAVGWGGNGDYSQVPQSGGGSGAGPQATSSQSQTDALYQQLKARATQGLVVDPNDPVLKAQTDAFDANATRTARDTINNIAESSGPQANITGQERMIGERTAQNTGAFRAQLMGRELQSRRDEIQQALTSQQGLLTDEQRMVLQEKMHAMDNEIAKQNANTAQTSVGNQFTLGQAGQSLDWSKALLSNDQFNNSLGLDAQRAATEADLRNRGMYN